MNNTRKKDFKLRIPQIPFFMDEAASYSEEHKVRMMILLVHRRGGKSTGCAMKDVYRVRSLLAETEIFKLRGDVDSSYPSIAFVAPTKVQARGIIWNTYKEYMREFEGVKFNNSLLKIEIPRPVLGDTITVELMASKNHDRIRGMKYREVNVDETQDSSEEAIYRSIMPTLSDSGGVFNAFGTAKGQDILYNMTVKALEAGQRVFLFPVTQTGVFTDKEIAEIRAKSIDGAFEREYMLDFTARLPGTFFKTKIEEMKREPWFFTSEHDPSRSNVVGVDIGVGAGFAAWTGQADYENHIVHIRDFYTGYDNLLSLKRDMTDDGFAPDVIFIPHDGGSRALGAWKKDTPKLRFKEVFPECIIKVQKKTVELMQDISRINDNLHLLRFPAMDAAGTDAHKGLRMLGEFSRKQDKLTGAYMDAIDKSRGVDHAADALRTLFNGLNISEGMIKRDFFYKRGSGVRTKKEVYRPWNPRMGNTGRFVGTGSRAEMMGLTT